MNRMKGILGPTLSVGVRVFWLLLGLPVIAVMVSPFVVVGFVVFAAGVGGLDLPLGVETAEALLVALGVTVAMSALCFSYSRASGINDVGHRVGYLAGRLLLFSAVLLITAGTVDLLALYPLVPETAPANTPLTAALAALILDSARTLSYAGAVALAGIAVASLYWHALRLYIMYVADRPSR